MTCHGTGLGGRGGSKAALRGGVLARAVGRLPGGGEGGLFVRMYSLGGAGGPVPEAPAMNPQIGHSH